MGNIVSRLKVYFHTKVENTKAAIRNRVNNTKQAIYTKIDHTKQAIVNKITDTKDAVCQKVIRVKTGVQNKVFAASDAVFSSVNNLQNGVVTRVTNTVTAVRNVRDGVVTKCTNTKNSVITKYTNTKNGVVTRYQNTCDAVVTRYTNTKERIVNTYNSTHNYVHDKFKQVREAKLTRYQKAKYSLIFCLMLFVFIVTLLTIWDLYNEDYEKASERIQAIWAVIQYLLENLWYYAVQASICIVYGIKIFLEYAWCTTKVIAAYTWAGTKIAADYTLHGMKIAAQYILEGLKIAFAYFIHGCKEAAHYIGIGSKLTWDYCVLGAKIAAEYLWHGTKLGTYYTIEGSKFTAHYIYIGVKYAIIHGSVALKNGTIKSIQWLFYFLTNFRAASKEAAIYLYETSIYTASCLTSGSYQGSVLLWDGTQYTAGKTYEGCIALAEWSAATSVVTWEYLTAAAQGFVHCTQIGILGIYDGTIYTTVTVYDWSVFVAETITLWIFTSANFLWTWSNYIIKTISHGLYIGFNKYGLVWAYLIANKLSHWSYGLGTIFFKFVVDLGTYVGNFVFVGSSHIYNLFYILFSFVYQLCTGVMGLVKVMTGGLVYGVTIVFGGIIWVLEETLFAYMYMLHQYNMYREILFVGFIVTMCLYCTGLMRDRKRSLEERIQRNGSVSSSEESDEDEDGLSTSRVVPRLKDLQLPPYTEQELQTQAQSAADDEEEQEEAQDLVGKVLSNPMTVASKLSKPMLEDFLPPTDDEDEFDLDSDVPDFMNLSGSEPEPEPPEEEDEEEKIRDQDLSFGSEDTCNSSSQDVPDINRDLNKGMEQVSGNNLDQTVPESQAKIPSIKSSTAGRESGLSGNKQIDMEDNDISLEDFEEGLDDLDLNLNIDIDPNLEADDEAEEEQATNALVQKLDSIKRMKEEANTEEKDQS